jgi:SAM-dependent methyltransferase
MLSQRGGVSQVPDFHNKPIHYYGGKEFPFKDNQFNYVICSHVLEHVADPEIFLKEVFRVGGGRGYLEYPLATYEYLYGFDVHLQFLKFDFAQRVLKYLPKRDTSFADFASVTALLNKTLACGWDDLCAANKQLFFEGVEFDQPFKIKKTTELAILLPSQSLIVPKSLVRQFFTRILNKIGL